MWGTSTFALGWGGSAMTLSRAISWPLSKKLSVMGWSFSSSTSFLMSSILFFFQFSSATSCFLTGFFFSLTAAGEVGSAIAFRASGVIALLSLLRRVDVFCMANCASSSDALLDIFSKSFTAFSLSSVSPSVSIPVFFFFFFFPLIGVSSAPWSPGGGPPDTPSVGLGRGMPEPADPMVYPFLVRFTSVTTQFWRSSLDLAQIQKRRRWGCDIQNS
mmetsp:Transcript_8403/g.16982  ORF Transcript_8403/g.16982 Transcript_8403/m.16982 type:complete len:216 (-) Transcript_8403:194-841(-)